MRQLFMVIGLMMITLGAQASVTEAFHASDNFQVRTSKTLGKYRGTSQDWKNRLAKHEVNVCRAVIHACQQKSHDKCARVEGGLESLHTTARWTKYSVGCVAMPMKSLASRMALAQPTE